VPKSRDFLFLVVRYGQNTTTPIAVFKTLERAEEYAGECQQDFIDRGFEEILFNVTNLIYYD
jgi:hypothetical protein